MALPTGSDNTQRNKSHVEMQPDALQGAAPGGLVFTESELPVSGAFSTPASLGGYSPNPNRSAQPCSSEQGMSVGTAAPTGLRR